MRYCAATASAVLFAAQFVLAGQTFDVVSIKQTDLGLRGYSIFTDPGRLTMKNVSLMECLRTAYGLPDYRISAKGLPSEKFNIVATAPSHVSKELDQQYERMLQVMLAERFKLAVHREDKALSFYALVPAKTGARLKPASGSGESFRSSFGRASALDVTLARLAEYLSRRMDRPVIDFTGLKGKYDFTLEWTPDETQVDTESGQSKASTEGSRGPSIYTALQEQLGLKLEARKGPVEILVVDHVEKVPTEN